jgi:hypothetical protein
VRPLLESMVPHASHLCLGNEFPMELASTALIAVDELMRRC